MKPREKLSVAAAQPPTAPHDVEANAGAHASVIREAEAALVVFPELSLTGYELDAAPIDISDPRLNPIVLACAQTGSVALAGAPVRVENHLHIGTLLIDRQGVRVAYLKMYLGKEEAKTFTPGPRPEAIEVEGWRLSLAICKDTGVPEHAAATASLGVEAYIGGTVKHSNESGVQDSRAARIATEHHLWVVISSFAGPTGGGFEATAGRSSVWEPGGARVAQATPKPGGMAKATLTMRRRYA